MKNSPIKLSVISPIYGAASLLPELVKRIHDAVCKITDDYEIILVEDNSPDNSWEIIKQLSDSDTKIVGLSLSRNFGQQSALNAGFDAATGDWIVTLDCDLQDEPERILDLYNEGIKGYDIVFASRVNRKDNALKKLGSRLFYKALGYLTDTDQDHSIGNFVLYKRKVVEAMSSVGDYHRYYPMLNKWIGFNTTILPVEHAERTDNVDSSYSLRKRLKLAFTTIIAFSDKPLRLVLRFGVSLVLLSSLAVIILIARYFILGVMVSGWLSVFLSIWMLSGIIIVILGLIGSYIGKVFNEAKNRPAYIIKETTHKEKMNV